MISKLFALVSVAAAALVFTGCRDSGQAAYGSKETNILGIVKHEPANYGNVGVNSFVVATDELYSRKDYSGNRTTFLWGLVTLTDY